MNQKFTFSKLIILMFKFVDVFYMFQIQGFNFRKMTVFTVMEEEHCASKLVAHSSKICIIHDQKTTSNTQLQNLPTPPSTPLIT